MIRPATSRTPRPNQVRGIYLVTGSAGVGKTTIAHLLADRGYNAIDADRACCEWVDHKGNPVRWRGVDSSGKDWLDKYLWVFDEAKLDALLQKHAADHLFICGITQNQREFYSRLRQVFFLDVDVETIITRLTRPDRDHHFGKEPHQQQRVRRQFHDFVQEFVEARAAFVDASRPPEDVADDILSQVDTQ